MEYTHHFVVIFGFLLCAVLGLVVYYSNPHRTTNQAFALLSAFVCSWQAFREIALLHFDGIAPALFNRLPVPHVHFWLLATIATSMIIIPLVQLLQLSYKYPRLKLHQLIIKDRIFLLLGLCMAILTGSGLLISSVELAVPYPAPVMTIAGRLLYISFFVASLAVIIRTFRRSLRRASGLQAFELQFMLLGTVSGLALGCFTSFILPLLPIPALKTFPTSSLTPIAGMVFNGFVAYGIVTRKIMDVKWVIRHLFAQGIIVACTLGIYAAAYLFLRTWTEPGSLLPSLAASAVAILAMGPLIGTTGRLANRLFINWTVFDYSTLLSQADEFMSKIKFTEELLEQFAEFTKGRFLTEDLEIYQQIDGVLRQTYPIPDSIDAAPIISAEAELYNVLSIKPEAIDLHLLERSRPVPSVLQLRRELREHKAQIALGITSSDGLDGVMFVGAKESGRIYTTKEKETLQLLSNRLSTALKSAQHYTEAKNEKIYNDILLQSLVNGVLAVSEKGNITVCNREAERILDLPDTREAKYTTEILPANIRRILHAALREDSNIRDKEFTLLSDKEDGKEINVRISSSKFGTEEGIALGALLILNDITELKKLEGQIRQNDRLASIGTLSAGMAHEIKNPLVSIKTFSQLLPERYKDEEFRTAFSEIMDGEITRIDSIVNQLLSFARPSKPCLVPMPLHIVIDRTLALVGNQLTQNSVAFNTYFTAEDDTIMGDANQLEQVFLNFILNASDSMPEGGKLTIKSHLFEVSDPWDAEEKPKSKIRIMIMDTGEGIPKDKQSHIFDPFYTTKSKGTGLGLSVSHSILDEHSCDVSVESEPDKGTVFYLTFDLIQQGVVA